MQKENPKPVPWLLCDRVNFWRFGKWQVRIERYGRRIAITPFVSFDWETGMVSVMAGWLFVTLCFDYDFDPKYDRTQEIEYPVARRN